ncbi:hypothetical protein E8A73_029205 [Polyangium aurulentum]|nr:hypothetical protein E8A73_029205 [Polyangium aurulentum]
MRPVRVRSSLVLRALPLAAALAIGVSASGCEDLDRFSTRRDDAYCGAITLGSAFRTGLSPRVQMRLELDASKLDGAESPGTLWTFEAATEGRPERRLLDGAPLRPIAPLAHDPLSRIEMGDGRERNAIYAVSPSDPEAESMLAFLSLRTDGGVEVRLVRAGTAEAAPPEGRRSLFGIFSLVRREGRCGF